MHDTAYEIGQLFFKTYLATVPDLILEIGSQNINGSLRPCAPPGSTYHQNTGADSVSPTTSDGLPRATTTAPCTSMLYSTRQCFYLDIR